MFDEREPAESELTPDLAAVERQLARLTPAAPRIDRDRLMFAAGRAAAGPSRLGLRFWRATTLTATAAALLLATMLVWQRGFRNLPTHESQSTIAVTNAQRPDDATAAHTTSRPEMMLTGWTKIQPPKDSYLNERYIALTRGVAALDSHSRAIDDGRDSPSHDIRPTQRDMLNELLPAPRRETTPRS